MRLYHGTAHYNEQPILEEGARSPLCASLAFKEAAFFALRKTPISNLPQTGIVIEFSGDLQEKDFARVESRGLLRNEQEIRVFTTEKLHVDAVWQWKGEQWSRKEGVTPPLQPPAAPAHHNDP